VNKGHKMNDKLLKHNVMKGMENDKAGEDVMMDERGMF
jgi:hypothetical protein